MRKIIEIDDERCDGCGRCVLGCAEGALRIVDGKARVISDEFCDGLGACIGECPTGALRIVERQADEFDPAAVETHLSKNNIIPGSTPASIPCGCPSTRIQAFIPVDAVKTVQGAADAPGASALTHWPIQIRLIPPNAPFLKGADLLVLADCSAVAFADLHAGLLKNKVVMMGCPKFDDVQAYVDKFSTIFRTAGIRRITVVFMEVPCCSGLPGIVQKALRASRAAIPVEELKISTRGTVCDKAKK